MNTPKYYHTQEKCSFKCELEHGPVCGHPMILSNNVSGRKTVQTLEGTLRVSDRHGLCTNTQCEGVSKKWRSLQWQQLAPLHSSYGFDVRTKIGWLRQTENMTFESIHQELSQRILISETPVRHMCCYRYLPLIACLLHPQWVELERISSISGLILHLDGVAPSV